jgi:hypothetical protein
VRRASLRCTFSAIFGPGDRRRRRATAADVADLVDRSVNDERRCVDVAKSRRAISGRNDGDTLADDPEAIVAAVVLTPDSIRELLGVRWKSRRADDACCEQAALDCFGAIGRRRAGKDLHRLGMDLAHARIARRRHDRRQRAHAPRMLDRDRLRDEAAHRRADEMHAVETKRVE